MGIAGQHPEFEEGSLVTGLHYLAGLLVVLLFIYLIVSLLKPEWFG
jgi:K+-transporting ATPase KdpF subunit